MKNYRVGDILIVIYFATFFLGCDDRSHESFDYSLLLPSDVVHQIELDSRVDVVISGLQSENLALYHGDLSSSSAKFLLCQVGDSYFSLFSNYAMNSVEIGDIVAFKLGEDDLIGVAALASFESGRKFCVLSLCTFEKIGSEWQPIPRSLVEIELADEKLVSVLSLVVDPSEYRLNVFRENAVVVSCGIGQGFLPSNFYLRYGY